MSDLQRVIARLLTDNEFRVRVRRYGTAALLEYHLSADELSAVLHLSLDQWDSGADDMLFDFPDGRRDIRT